MKKNKKTLQLAKPYYVNILSKSGSFNVLKYMPRLFTLSTNNNSYLFNTDLLAWSSKTISKYIDDNPTNLKYHLNIFDDKNIIEKIGKIYQGELVEFKKDEYKLFQTFTEELKLISMPEINLGWSKSREHLELDFNKKHYIEFTLIESSIKIDQSSLIHFLCKKQQKSYSIHTKKNEYVCDIGIFSSSVLREFFEKNPNADHYLYEFDDEEGEFKYICDLFNFQKVQLSSLNIDVIKDMAEDLGIECIMKSIDDYYEKNEKVSQSIDDQQKIINSIDDLFGLLYNIKERTVDSVVNSIINSKWSIKEEDVCELSSFILQVIKTNIDLHQYLIDLILKLNDERDDKRNKLRSLLPFVVKQLFVLFPKKIGNSEKNNDLICPFIYLLYKKGIITKEKLYNALSSYCFDSSYLNSWFIPELVEVNNLSIDRIDFKKRTITIKKSNMDTIQDSNNIKIYQAKPTDTSFYPCNSNNIEEYKEMRDKFEYDNDIAKALRNDDVDTFQSIISKNVDALMKNMLPKNMFEPFINTETRYIDYAAAYGSIKCFKYLLLNYQKIGKSTLKMSIIGGKMELIRIVDNTEIENKKPLKAWKSMKNIDTASIQEKAIMRALTQSIKMHKNDIVDWILENKFSLINKNENLFSLAKCAITNGNVHSFIQLIDNGFDIQNYSDQYLHFLNIISERGFYLFTVFFINLIDKSNKEVFSIDMEQAISSGNISIIKLFEKSMDQNSLFIVLIYGIKANYTNVIKYFFESLVYRDFVFDPLTIVDIMDHCINNYSKETTNYVIEKINEFYQFDINILLQIINKTINSKKIEVYKEISDTIYKNNSISDFTPVIIKASSIDLIDLIKHIIDMKYRKSDFNLSETFSQIGSTNLEIFELLLNDMDQPFYKKRMIRCINEAIMKGNLPLVDYLLKEDAPLDDALLSAVKKNDFELVGKILEKKSDPLYINKMTKNGTALYQAVQNNNIQIVEKLLSIPGINPSLFYEKYKTPLVLAASQCRIKIFNLILNFYGDEIKQEKIQIQHCLNSITDNSENKKLNNGFLPHRRNSNINEIINKIIELDLGIDYSHLFLFACQNDIDELFEMLIKKDDIDVNIYNIETGDTPLMIAINNKKINIIKQLLKHPKININAKNCKGYSALIIAAISKQNYVIDLLIKNDKFDPIESNINLAFFISSEKTFLSFKSLDVNYIPINHSDIVYKTINDNKYIITPFLHSVITGNEELFDLIVQHPSFIKDEFLFIEAAYFAFSENREKMIRKTFQLLKEYHIDINSRVFDGSNLLFQFINLQLTESTLLYILNLPEFDSKKSGIVEAFNKTFSSIKISGNDRKNTKMFKLYRKTRILDILYQYDSNHDHLIDLNTKLTEMYSKIFYDTFNPNELIDNISYPLEYAIKNDLYVLSLCLINSNKIDFDKMIYNDNKSDRFLFGNRQYSYYIHLAACYGRIEILKEILSRHLSDINKINSAGRTPLIEACANKQIECVKYLFEFDDLDFLHRDDKGDDALEVIDKNNKAAPSKDNEKENKKEIKDKNEYLSELLKTLNSVKKEKLQFHGKEKFFMETKKATRIKKSANDILKAPKTNIYFPSLRNKETKENKLIANLQKQISENNENKSIESKQTNEKDKIDSIKSKQKTEKNENNSIKSKQTELKISNSQKNSSNIISFKQTEPKLKNNENKISFSQNPKNSDDKSNSNSLLSTENSLQKINKEFSVKTNQVKSIISSDKNKTSTQTQTSQNFDNPIQKSVNKTKFQFHIESFSEKPKLNFQNQQKQTIKEENSNNDQSKIIQRNFESEVFDNNSLNKEIENEFGPLSVHSRRKTKEIEETKFDYEDDFEEYYQILDYQQPFIDRNQIMILQQQQQWLQMIQMNNQLQTQINIKMMNYACTNNVKQKQSKKKKKQNK